MRTYAYDEKYYSQGGLVGFHQASFPIIARAFEEHIAIESTRPAILDFGCGDGFYGSFLAEKASRLDGVDYSRVLEVHPNRKFYSEYSSADLGQSWTSTDAYNIVFSSEVVEHVRDYRQFLTNAFRALEPGGQLFLTTTTYVCYLYVLLIVYRRRISWEALSEFTRGLLGDEGFRTKFIMRLWDYSGGHFHGFSRRQLISGLEEAGFVVVTIKYLHIENMIPIKYLSQPYSGQYKFVVIALLPLIKLIGRILNWMYRRFDLDAQNIMVVARRPVP